MTTNSEKPLEVPPDPDRDRRLTRPTLTPEQQAEWRKSVDPQMAEAFGFV
jgi:hypothetical protein